MSIQNQYSIEDFLFDESFRVWALDNEQSSASTWDQWLMDHPEAKDVAADARQIIKSLHFKKHDISDSEIKAELNRLHLSIERSERRHATRHINPMRRWIAAAAVIILLLTFGAIIFNSQMRTSPDNIEWVEVVIPNGEVQSLILPDQSIAFVNAGSTIRYKEDFGTKTREIELAGEAWFDVKHDTERPFIVHTSEADVKVLGTAFNVKAYDDDNIHQVSLERGKVMIMGEYLKNQTLVPDQSWLLIRNKNTARVFKTNNIATHSAWRKGKIIFNNTSFYEIAKRLERSHNIAFTIDNQELLSCHYTGEFSMDDSVEKILHIISLTAPFEYSISGNNITIK